MNSNRFSNSSFTQSPGYGSQNTQYRNFSPMNSNMKNSSPMQGWGTPARGYSFNPYNFQRPNSNVSPRNQQMSPRHQSFSKSPVSPQCRFPGHKDTSPFRTPKNPFSPPGNFRGGFRGNGRKSFDRHYTQNPRHDPNCNPGSSRNIEDYYHPDMLEDPWNFCSPVPVSNTMATVT